jgi:hypothetical protein
MFIFIAIVSNQSLNASTRHSWLDTIYSGIGAARFHERAGAFTSDSIEEDILPRMENETAIDLVIANLTKKEPLVEAIRASKKAPEIQDIKDAAAEAYSEMLNDEFRYDPRDEAEYEFYDWLLSSRK